MHRRGPGDVPLLPLPQGEGRGEGDELCAMLRQLAAPSSPKTPTDQPPRTNTAPTSARAARCRKIRNAAAPPGGRSIPRDRAQGAAHQCKAPVSSPGESQMTDADDGWPWRILRLRTTALTSSEGT